ncbi:glycosyltransferase family 2 protein [bacterium]|nr:glycosyltransferase family 2 protein [bacterium]
MDKIAIIIVHYNTDEDTRETLKSLQDLRTGELEVRTFVVDNASKEPFTLKKDDKNNKNIRIIRSDSNLGFTGGNNLGFATASKEFNPDYFLLLNSDTLIHPDFLVNLYNKLQQKPEWALAVPKIYFAKDCEFHRDSYRADDRGRVLWYAGGSIDWDNLLTIHLGVDEVDRGQFDQAREVDFATGCCFLVRREILASIGDFDDRYFLYYEDVDLCQRVIAHGHQIGYVPESIIWHKNGGSTAGSGSDLQTFYQTRNRLQFFFTHGNLMVRQRVIRLAIRLLTHGSRVEKLGARNFLLQKLGKQVAI